MIQSAHHMCGQSHSRVRCAKLTSSWAAECRTQVCCIWFFDHRMPRARFFFLQIDFGDLTVCACAWCALTFTNIAQAFGWMSVWMSNRCFVFIMGGIILLTLFVAGCGRCDKRHAKAAYTFCRSFICMHWAITLYKMKPDSYLRELQWHRSRRVNNSSELCLCAVHVRC